MSASTNSDVEQVVRVRTIRHLPSCEKGGGDPCCCLPLPDLVAALRHNLGSDVVGQRILDDLEALATAAIVESIALTQAFGDSLTGFLGGNPSPFVEHFRSQAWDVQDAAFGCGYEAEDGVPYRTVDLRAAELELEALEDPAKQLKQLKRTVAQARKWLAEAKTGELARARKRLEAEHRVRKERDDG